MKQGEIKKLVDEYIEKFGIKDWKIAVIYTTQRDYSANVLYEDIPNKEANIIINKSENREKKEVRDTIIHELAHVLLYDFTIYAEEVIKFMRDNPTQKLNYKEVFDNMYEKEDLLVEKLTKIILKLE